MQAKNGTATGASTFAPIGYSTSENIGDSFGISGSAAGMAFNKGMGIGMLIIGGVGGMVVGLT